MKLSIIIPVSRDMRLLKCVESIDINVEIVVIFNNNPSEKLIRAISKDPRVKVVIVHERGCNLAKVFNIGIAKASYNFVLLANSDCIFYPGQIAECYKALQNNTVVKGHIVFEANSFGTQLVAQLRFLFHEVFFQKKMLFGPGLAFRRSIINDIGGYYFDEDMGWGEDGELSERIYQSALLIKHLDKVMLKHPPESISHDLRVAYKIGYAEWVQHAKHGVTVIKAILADALNLFCDRKKQFRIAFSHGRLALVAYLLLWKIVFHVGYYKHAILGIAD